MKVPGALGEADLEEIVKYLPKIVNEALTEKLPIEDGMMEKKKTIGEQRIHFFRQ